MRILYITPSFQHPTLRGPTRCYQFIRDLSRRHSITLLSLTRFDIPKDVMAEMTTYADRICVTRVPSQEPGDRRPLLRRTALIGHLQKNTQYKKALGSMRLAARRLLQENTFDLVLFHGKWEFPVIEPLEDIPIVIDVCDATSARALESIRHSSYLRRPALFVRYLRVLAIEEKIRKKTPYLAFISARDRDALLSGRAFQSRFGGSARIVPGGVDVEYWTRKRDSRQPNALVFAGVMDYRPNEDAALYFLRRILPLVRAQVPDIRFTIVGRNPSPLLVRSASGHANVTVTGYVPDVRPYLEQATISVAPLRFAAGVQNKALEAMSMELPVVATPIVAEGLRIDGKAAPLVVGHDPQDFARSIVSLLGQPERLRSLSAEGRRFVTEYFHPTRCAEELEKLCLLAVAEGCRTPFDLGSSFQRGASPQSPTIP